MAQKNKSEYKYCPVCGKKWIYTDCIKTLFGYKTYYCCSGCRNRFEIKKKRGI